MFRITALYQDCEIAYCEEFTYQDAIEAIKQEVFDGIYAALDPRDIGLICHNDNSIVVLNMTLDFCM